MEITYFSHGKHITGLQELIITRERLGTSACILFFNKEILRLYSEIPMLARRPVQKAIYMLTWSRRLTYPHGRQQTERR